MTNTSKATKVTLNSILFAQAPVLPAPEEGKAHTKTALKEFDKDLADHVNTVSTNLAQYFVEKAVDTDLICKILTATVQAIPAAVQYQKEEADRQEKAREEARVKAQAERERQAAEAEKVAEDNRKKMLELLLSGGIDLAVAEAAVKASAKVKTSHTGATNSYNRVTVKVGGKEYDMPEKGNMSQELKDLVAESNLDREAFIAKYRVDATADAAE